MVVMGWALNKNGPDWLSPTRSVNTTTSQGLENRTLEDFVTVEDDLHDVGGCDKVLELELKLLLAREADATTFRLNIDRHKTRKVVTLNRSGRVVATAGNVTNQQVEIVRGQCGGTGSYIKTAGRGDGVEIELRVHAEDQEIRGIAAGGEGYVHNVAERLLGGERDGIHVWIGVVAIKKGGRCDLGRIARPVLRAG